ncbi:hypothetical protein CJ030_MR6G015597 [Morella rubra]|uniref:Uncharacterized protein n=1 Tax=Morella rubra TaxID=262757 RepID=A0A6A1V918_9ROSI|nr:hypothetical protein CJ030_MR6G015597 [Morella rubra]
MQEESSDLSVCPSFSSYSSDRLADIAGAVTREFRGEDRQRQGGHGYPDRELNDDDFEFVSVRKSDDEVVIDGQIGPVFPIFNRDLLSDKSQRQTDGAHPPKETEGHDVQTLRVPLKTLFIEDRDPSSLLSTSSEEEAEDELDGVPPGTYCIWTPNNSNSAKSSPSTCKKSNSTGTMSSGASSSSSASKRWRLLSLLRRSNSEGKDSFVFLTPKKVATRVEKAEVGLKEKKAKKPAKETLSSAHEAFYLRNRAMKEEDKRRTYLPYRQDLVGFWTSVGAMGKTFPF